MWDVGSAVTHCYGPMRGLDSWSRRQRMLRCHYNFTCSCDACLLAAEDADPVELYLQGAHCASRAGAGAGASARKTHPCDGVVFYDFINSELEQESGLGWRQVGQKCNVCGHVLSEDDSMAARAAEQEGKRLLDAAAGILADARARQATSPDGLAAGVWSGQWVGKKGLEEAVTMLKTWRSGMGEALHDYHPLVGEVEDLLSHGLVALGRMPDALPHAMLAAQALEARFGGLRRGGAGPQQAEASDALLSDWKSKTRQGADGAGARCASLLVAHGLAWAAIVSALASSPLVCLTCAAAACADFSACLGREHPMCQRMLQLACAAASRRLAEPASDLDMYTCIYGSHGTHELVHQESEAAARAMAVEFEALSAALAAQEEEPHSTPRMADTGEESLEEVGRRLLADFHSLADASGRLGPL